MNYLTSHPSKPGAFRVMERKDGIQRCVVDDITKVESTTIYLALSYFRVPDVPEILEIEDETILALYTSKEAAEKACEDEREKQIQEYLESDNEGRAVAEECVDAEYRFDTKEMEVQS